MKAYRPLALFADGADLPLFLDTPDCYHAATPTAPAFIPTHDQLTLLENPDHDSRHQQPIATHDQENLFDEHTDPNMDDHKLTRVSGRTDRRD